MKTFGQILRALLSSLRISPASGFVPSAPPPTSSGAGGVSVPRPIVSEVPIPRTQAGSGAGSGRGRVSAGARRPLARPDYASFYQAARCDWGGRGNAYVPGAPWRSDAPPVSSESSSVATPGFGSTSGPSAETDDTSGRNGPTANAERLDSADCRNLLDRPEEDEFGTRVFRLFD